MDGTARKVFDDQTICFQQFFIESIVFGMNTVQHKDGKQPPEFCIAHAMKRTTDRIPDTGCEFFASEVFGSEQCNVRTVTIQEIERLTLTKLICDINAPKTRVHFFLG